MLRQTGNVTFAIFLDSNECTETRASQGRILLDELDIAENVPCASFAGKTHKGQQTRYRLVAYLDWLQISAHTGVLCGLGCLA